LSDRLSARLTEPAPQLSWPCGMAAIKGGDCPAVSPHSLLPRARGPPMIAQRVGQLELARLRERLMRRDLAVVAQVGELRLMSARQIEALHFPHGSSASSA